MQQPTMVTKGLQDDGVEPFSVSLAVTIRATQRHDPDVASIDGTVCFEESSVPCQPCKPMGRHLQVFRSFRKMNDLVTNGHHLLSDPVDDAVDGGTSHPKHF